MACMSSTIPLMVLMTIESKRQQNWQYLPDSQPHADRLGLCCFWRTFFAGRCTGGGAMPIAFCSCKI